MDQKLVVGMTSSTSLDGDIQSSPTNKGIAKVEKKKEIEEWAAIPFPDVGNWNGILMVPTLLLFHGTFVEKADAVSMGIEGQAAHLHDLAMEKSREQDYHEQEKAVADKLIEGYGDLFVNYGVVGALMVSIVFPIALEPMELADSSIDYFGYETTKGLFNAFYACIILSLVVGLNIIFESVTFYKHLSFWMPDAESKLKYTKEVNLLFLVLKGTMLIYTICIGLAFGSAALVSPEAGLIALGGIIVMIMLCNSTMISEQHAYRVLHDTAKRLSAGVKVKTENGKY